MGEYCLDFKTELLTLEELSVIAVASQLWSLPDIRQELEKFLNKYYSFKNQGNAGKYFRKMSIEIPKMVSEISKELDLAEVQKKKVQKRVRDMGEKTFDWIMYLTSDLQLDIKYTETIYWTSMGLIDVDKIFNSFWMNFYEEDKVPTQNFNAMKSFYEMVHPLHFLACFFAQEEFIIAHQADILKEIRSVYGLCDTDDNSDILSIMTILISCFKEWKTSYTSYRYLWKDINTFSLVEKLEINEDICSVKAFICFWNHLDSIQQHNYLEHILSNHQLRSFYRLTFGTDNQFQIALFVLDKMDASQRSKFICQNFHLIFFNCLRKESLQKFCLPLVNKVLPHPFYMNTGSITNFFNCLMDDLERAVTISNDDEAHLQIVHVLLQKKDMDNLITEYTKNGIFHVFYVPFLKLIINHPKMEKRRDEIISKGKLKFKALIKSNDFQLLNEFMDEVLVSDSEKIKFQQDYNFLKEFIANDQLDLIDNVLIWMRGDEAYVFKIQLQNLFCRLVPKMDDSVLKMLKWYAETQEEPLIKYCKDKSILKEFCCELIYNMWLRVTSLSVGSEKRNREISRKILNSAFGFEKEIFDFIENELVKDESCVKFFCEYVVENFKPDRKEADFSWIDQFFDFCSLSNKKIDDIKNLVADNINDWIEEYGVRCERFDIVVPLLDWVYGNKRSNCKMLKHKFPNHGAVSLYYKNRGIPKSKKKKPTETRFSRFRL